MSTQTIETITEKVKHLLERANHPNTPQPEAETALALAQRFITKYNIDEASLREHNDAPEEIVKCEIVITGKYALDRVVVAGVVARANQCFSYRTKNYKKVPVRRSPDGTQYYRHDKDGFKLVFHGTQRDVFATQVLWTAVEALGARSLPHGDRATRSSWWKGFSVGISQALEKAHKEAVQEAQSSGQLVCLDNLERAEKEVRAQTKLRTTYRQGASRSGAFNHGQRAGSSFSHGGIGGGAIGALGR
jgi:hypothetical protein